MNGAEPFPVIGGLAAWVSALDADTLGDDVVHAATRAIVDTAGVALAGAGTPLAQKVRCVVENETLPGRATMLVGGPGRKPVGAALANGVAAHLLDFDDTHYDGIVHASCVVFPAALSCAEEANASASDVLAAFVAGSEVTYALGRALPGLFWQGWWTTATLGSIGAAAAAARALRLDAARTAHALAIASCFTSGLRTILGTDANPLGAGLTAQAGVRAALLAQDGVEGPLDTIEHRIGFASVFNDGRLDVSRFQEIGRHFALVTPGLAFKAFPACSGAQAASQAMAELLAERTFRPGDVTRIVCRVTSLVSENLRYPHPADLTQAQFSLPFAIGCQLAAGRFGVAQLTDSWLHSPVMRSAMAKVEMQPVEDLVAHDQRERFPEAAEVTCILADGRKISRTVLAARGMPSDPQSDETLRAKFMDCATSVTSPETAVRLYERLANIRSADTAAELFAPIRDQENTA